ncbi:MAG: N-acetylmuramic acid 6-phosphate etherase [Candidatus Anammoxibacter sp.]
MRKDNKDHNKLATPDRSLVGTEQRNKKTTSLHKFSVEECVNVMNEENRSVHLAMEKAGKCLADFIETVEVRFKAGGRLIYIGAGTSGRLGVLDAAEIPPTFNEKHGRIIAIIAGGDSSLRKSSEGKEDNLEGARSQLDEISLSEDDTVLGIAAGGTTPYVLGALTYAKQCQQTVLTGLLVCTPITKHPNVDHLIVIETGPEVLTGSTRMKAGTATKLALNTISTTLMIRSGKVYENLMVDVRATNDKLRDRAARIITTLTGLSRKESFELLTSADGSTKTAVVMHLCHTSRVNAESLLKECGNRLDMVLDSL